MPFEKIGLVIDTETTGLNPARDEIIEIGMVLFSFSEDDGSVLKIIDTYESLRQPNCRITQQAQAIHGITDQELYGKRLDLLRVESLCVQSDLIIAHNARFDYSFFARVYPPASKTKWYCSMSGIPWRLKGAHSRSLNELCIFYGIPVRSAHRALSDALMTLDILSIKGSESVSHLFELLNGKPYIG